MLKILPIAPAQRKAGKKSGKLLTKSGKAYNLCIEQTETTKIMNSIRL